MEESFEFYDRLINWIHEYFANGNNNLELTIKLTYFNTSSSRCIADMLRIIKSYQDKGKVAKVIWMYPNDDMQQEGIDIMDETRVQMDLVEYDAE